MILVKRIRQGSPRDHETLSEDGEGIALPESVTSAWFIILGSVSSLAVFGNALTSTSETALAFSTALCTSLGCVYFERAIKIRPSRGSERFSEKLPHVSEESTPFVLEVREGHGRDFEACVCGAAFYFALATCAAAFAFESVQAPSRGAAHLFVFAVVFCILKVYLASTLVSVRCLHLQDVAPHSSCAMPLQLA